MLKNRRHFLLKIGFNKIINSKFRQMLFDSNIIYCLKAILIDVLKFDNKLTCITINYCNQISMFLSKKNAVYFNKPKNVPKNRKPLGGWDDDSDKQKQQNEEADMTSEQRKNTNINILEGFQEMQPQNSTVEKIERRTQNKQRAYFDWDALDAKQGIQCEKKLVEQIVQPGGIRIKPNENMLSQFLKQCKSMETPIVGSLLLSKIEANYPFQVKAKALHTIQYIVKKNQKYAAYFKQHASKLDQFPEPQDNVDNYRKILKGVVTTIGGSSLAKNNYIPEGDVLQFVDHGQYDDKRNDPISFIKSNQKKGGKKVQASKKAFVSPNDAKKPKVVGPTMKGPNQISLSQNSNGEDDILGLDLLGATSNQKSSNSSNQMNLLDDGLSKPKQNQQKGLSYDDLFSNMGSPDNSLV